MLKKDLRKLIERTSDAAYVVNIQGVVVAWNKAAKRLFGVSAQKAIGQACRTLFKESLEARLLTWGLIPSWSTEGTGFFNARGVRHPQQFSGSRFSVEPDILNFRR